MNAFANKVALVTGGAGGLGRELCRMLAGGGAHVLVADARSESSAEVAALCRSAGAASAEGVTIDLRDAAAVEAAVDELLRRFGTVDILINNAGVDLTVPVVDLPVDDWDRIVAVNLRAPFLLARKILPVMYGRGRGEVVNIVSTAALRAWPNASAYHATKWGLRGLSHALHCEARVHGVRVSAVIAGGMVTPFITDRFPDVDRSTLQDPATVAAAVRQLLTLPEGSTIPEIMVTPMKESSWP